MKPSSWDKQLGMVSPLKSAAIQSGQTNHPSKNEVGLDVSHHIHLSLEGKGKYFFLDILFHRMSVMGMLRQLAQQIKSNGRARVPSQVFVNRTLTV
jgi:hypothetical protein